jgi:tetratricopeptide (TPR) repeat protein
MNVRKRWTKRLLNTVKQLKNDETFAEAHGDLGLLLLKKGARVEAAVELSRGLMGKADTRYHRRLAELLREGKMYGLALFHYSEALKAFPQDVSIHAGLRMYTTTWAGSMRPKRSLRPFL